MGATPDVVGGHDTADDLGLGREAFARHAWGAAREHLARADPALLAPQDWHALATAAYLVADWDTAVRAWQEAFAQHTAASEPLAAAMDAQWIALVHHASGSPAVARGWVARGHRLLEGQADDAEARGFLLVHEFYRHLEGGDLAAASECSRQVLGIGQRWGNGDLTAFGLVSQGRMLIYGGQVRDGLALLDEAMACLTAGEVSPITAGSIYCAMVEGCQEVSEYHRMTEWTEALDPLVRQPAGPRALHGAVCGAPWPDPARARLVRPGAGRAGPGGRALPRRGQRVRCGPGDVRAR